jgi:hypothetical protein
MHPIVSMLVAGRVSGWVAAAVGAAAALVAVARAQRFHSRWPLVAAAIGGVVGGAMIGVGLYVL